MKKSTCTIKTYCVAVLAASTVAVAGGFDLSWHTVDGGGGYSANGSLELEGTIAQHDAGPSAAMAGGSFELVGGFWTAVAPVACTCLGDMNGDTLLDGADVQFFIDCVLTGGACGCADLDGVPGLDEGDVALFVSDLLAGATCP